MLIRGGAKSSVAEATVAKLLRKAGYEKPPIRGDKTITRSTIEKWRKDVRQSKRGELILCAFDSLLDGESLPKLVAISNGYPELFRDAYSPGMLECLVTISMLQVEFPESFARKVHNPPLLRPRFMPQPTSVIRRERAATKWRRRTQ